MGKKKWALAVLLGVALWGMAHNNGFAAASSQRSAVPTPQVTLGKQSQVTLGVQRSRVESSFLETAFAASGATPTGYLVHDWTQVNQQFESVNQLASDATAISKELSLVAPHILERRTQAENYYEIYGVGPGHTAIRVVLSSFRFGLPTSAAPATSAASAATGAPAAPATSAASAATGASAAGEAETLLVLAVQKDATKTAGLTQDWERMASAVAGQGWAPQISACIEGFRNDRMSDGQRIHWAQTVLQNVHAVRVEGLTSNNVTSISGYSHGQDIAILAAGHPINLQVAAYYNAYRHHTDVLVGTPVITIPY